MKTNKCGAVCVLLCAALMLSACGSGAQESGAEATTAAQLSSGMIDPDYSDRDLDGTWDASDAVTIACSGASADISGKGAKAADGVVTITAAGTYVFSGSLSGQIDVDVSDTEKVQIVLNGIDITCGDGPAIYVVNADKVFLTLAEGTQNSVTDGAAYALADGEDEPDAAIFSKDDLTINGSGALTVLANYDKGVHSKDDLKITGGTIGVTSVGDGIKGRDCVAVFAGNITIDAGEDGIQSNNDEDAGRGWVSIDGGVLHITAGLDGIQAETTLQVTGGTLDIVTGGGASEAAASDSGAAGTAPQSGMTAPDVSGGATQTGPGAQNGAEAPDASSGATGNTGTGTGTAESGQVVVTAAVTTASVGSAQTLASSSASSSGDSFKGLKGAQSVYICGGDITIDSADDAVHSNGSVTVCGGSVTAATGDDGFHADADLLISGGTISVTQSYEGLEGQTVTVSGGEISVVSSDDGLNAAGGSDSSSAGGRMGADSFASDSDCKILISGGYLRVIAGGDGIDSNGDLSVTGGVTLVDGPTDNGNGALDYAGSGTITGGVLIAAGSVGMAQSLDSETQGVILASFAQQSGGTRISLLGADGTALVTYVPSKQYACAVISAPGIAKGETYTVASGGAAEGADGNGFAQDAAVSGTAELCSATMSALTQTVGTAGTGAGGFGGAQGAGPGSMPGGHGRG